MLICWPLTKEEKRNCTATVILLQMQSILHFLVNISKTLTHVLLVKLVFTAVNNTQYIRLTCSTYKVIAISNSWQKKRKLSVYFFHSNVSFKFFLQFFPSVCIPIQQQSNQQLHLEQWEKMCLSLSFSL